MTTFSLDELIVPAPPYRMARPVATLAGSPSTGGEQLKGIEAAPPAPEKTKQEKARERVAAVRARDRVLESEYPDLEIKGKALSTAVASVRKVAAVSAPEVGSEIVYIKPSSPTGGYEMPTDAKTEMDRIRAKQAELRADGKEEEARQWDTALGQYDRFQRRDMAQFYAEKKKTGAPKSALEARPTHVPKPLDSLEAQRESLLNAKDKPGNYKAKLREYDEAIAKRNAVPEAAPAQAEPSSTATVETNQKPVSVTIEKPITEMPIDPGVLSDTSRPRYEKAKAAGEDVTATEKFIREQMAFRAQQAQKAESAPEKPGAFSSVEDEMWRVLKQLADARKPGGDAHLIPELEKRAKDYEEYFGNQQNGKDVKRARGPLDGDDAAREAAQARALQQERFGEAPPPRAPKEAAPRTYESGYISSAVEWASRKTDDGAWLDTLLPRLKSVYHRQFAERRAWQQEKASGSFDRAVIKRDDFAAKRADTEWPMKKFYAWRERAWTKTVHNREAIVNKHDLYRTRRIDRHNELQREVSARYDRELTPYRGIKESLELEQKMVVKVIGTLSEKYNDALKTLEGAEAKRSGLFGRRGKAAADKIRRQAQEIEQRINAQRGLLDKVNKPLANANAKIEKYEGLQRGVVDGMKFPEMEGLNSIRRAKPGSLPGRRSFSSYTTETTPESAEAGDRSSEEWSAGEFVGMWNDNGLVRIADPAAFEKFVADQRTKAKESGPVKLNRMLQLTGEYLTSISSSQGFIKDSRFFLQNVPKGTIKKTI